MKIGDVVRLSNEAIKEIGTGVNSPLRGRIGPGIKKLPLTAAVLLCLAGCASENDDENSIYQQLTNMKGVEWMPAVSKDGRIAFSRYRKGNLSGSEIYVRDDDGTIRRLTDAPGIDFYPAWSLDGKYIYFVHGHAGVGNRQILRVPSTGGPYTLDQAEAVTPKEEYWSDFSMRGGTIVAVRGYVRGVKGERLGIYIGSLGEPSSKWKYLTDSHGAEPALSPDGKDLLTSSNKDGARHIYIQPTDGSKTPRKLTGSGAYSSPSWVDNEKCIAVHKLNGSLVLFNRDGTPYRNPHVVKGKLRTATVTEGGECVVFEVEDDLYKSSLEALFGNGKREATK